MTPFDRPLTDVQDCPDSLAPPAPQRRQDAIKNKTRNNLPVPASTADELPPVWRIGPGESNAQLYIYGPRAARFDEPPPKPPEAPEPEEAIGESLTGRQLLFCERYVERPVAVRAAREAGYAEATAATQAARLLKHPKVMRRILELRRKRDLEHAYRRETLLDKFDLVFAQAVERNDLYAAIKALTMEARLARIQEAMPGFREVRRFDHAGEQMVWDAVTRLEQKLTEITVGDFPGAAAAVPAEPFLDRAAAETKQAKGWVSLEQRTADAVRRRRSRSAGKAKAPR